MSALTHERLQEALDYNPETGVFMRRCKSCLRKAGSDSHGYIALRVDYTKYLAHRLAWFYVYGAWPEGELDHINGDKADNRISNLREATRSQNMANGPRQRNNTSGVKGVTYDKLNRKWMAHLQLNGKFKNLGRFVKKEEAIAARQRAASDAWGEFACSG